MQCLTLSCIVGSTRFPSAKTLPDQPSPSSTACGESKKHQPEGKQAARPDGASTCTGEQVSLLPQESKKQSDKLEEAHKPAAPAQHAASTEPPPAAQSRETVLNFASHPNAVDAIRCYGKSQVRWLLESISHTFKKGDKRDNASDSFQPDQQTRQNERK